MKNFLVSAAFLTLSAVCAFSPTVPRRAIVTSTQLGASNTKVTTGKRIGGIIFEEKEPSNLQRRVSNGSMQLKAKESPGMSPLSIIGVASVVILGLQLLSPWAFFFFNPLALFLNPFVMLSIALLLLFSPLIGPAIFGGILFVSIRNLFRGPVDDQPEQEYTDSLPASILGTGRDVVQVSLEMDVADRSDPDSILGILDRISQTSNVTNKAGLSDLASRVALELLRRRSSIVRASGKSQNFETAEAARREFDNRSVREQSKFNAARNDGGASIGSQPTKAVVTILLSINGDSTQFPQLNSMAKVEEALEIISSNARAVECVQAAEVYYTPAGADEVLTDREILADYPDLNSV